MKINLKKDYFSKLNYFKDRQKIGYVVTNVRNIINIVQKINSEKNTIKRKIISLRKKGFFTLENQ